MITRIYHRKQIKATWNDIGFAVYYFLWPVKNIVVAFWENQMQN